MKKQDLEFTAQELKLSPNQYVILTEASRKGITLERMLELVQTSGGSLVRRKMLQWTGDLFHPSAKGQKALEAYQDKNRVLRGNWSRPLSIYIKGGLQNQASKVIQMRREVA